jgi:tetratricopeptide (TPR) repeat protein
MKFSPGTIERAAVVAVVAAIFIGGISLGLNGQENLGRGRISGFVVDEKGAPVVGAQIVAQSMRGTGRLGGVSDKKGRFAIVGLGTGKWRVTASLDGFVDAVIEMDVSQITKNPPITLKMKKTTGASNLRTDEAGLEIIDRGNALLQEEKYDEAVAAFREFLDKYPDVYQIGLNVATAHFKKGDVETAETEYKGVLAKILEVHGDYSDDKVTAFRAFSGLGELCLKTGDLEAGQTYFREALRISPEDEVAAYNVGEIFFSNQKVDEAVEYFEMAVKIKPEWSKPYHKLGFVFLNKGEFDKSLENFKKFIELDPEDSEVPNVKNIMAAIEKMKKKLVSEPGIEAGD